MKINLANEISALGVWRAERQLSIESQIAGFKGNFFEEVAEFYRAKDDYDRVDALCDMIVFLINASKSINEMTDKSFEIRQVAWNGGDKHRDCEFHFENAITCLMKCGVGYTDDSIPISYLLSAINALGFHARMCLSETIKEISSRTGKYNSELKKFVKDKGAYTLEEVEAMYAQDKSIDNIDTTESVGSWEVGIYYSNGKEAKERVRKWYKADYEKCK